MLHFANIVPAKCSGPSSVSHSEQFSESCHFSHVAWSHDFVEKLRTIFQKFPKWKIHVTSCFTCKQMSTLPEIMLAASSPLGAIGRDFGWGKNIIRAWYNCNKIIIDRLYLSRLDRKTDIGTESTNLS